MPGIKCMTGCGHEAMTKDEHFNHQAMHHTASVMGNPEYLEAIKDIPRAKDERLIGIEEIRPQMRKPNA